MTLRQIVEEIGGGVAQGRKFKAVQVGGPSGGCVPAELADTPIDYEPCKKWGPSWVLAAWWCWMTPIAWWILLVISSISPQDQSCGKCTFCRIGTRRMLDILDRIVSGKGGRETSRKWKPWPGWLGPGASAPWQNRAQSRPFHFALFPFGVRGASPGPLPRGQMQGFDFLLHQ